MGLGFSPPSIPPRGEVTGSSCVASRSSWIPSASLGQCFVLFPVSSYWVIQL